ncbi:hypothetical protein [Methylobacter sp.]|uniref:hypothetical protein n=1 Tax=Methylobacter sp. TaxID=2051955 RepID=UPI00120FE8E2|nr:hypothetical protein [Methylobacter sp.]TAK59554.1 MAG: hypothetical protein EPO18_20545 [Methylobacter sp.]
MESFINLKTWAEFKAYIDATGLGVQYTEDGRTYDVWSDSSGIIRAINLRKAAGQDPGDEGLSDFENNYKPKANKPGKILTASADVIYELDTYTTVNAYGNARPIKGDFPCSRFKTKQFYLENVGSNAAQITVVGIFADPDSNQNVITIVSNQGVGAGQGVDLTEDRPFEKIRVLARAAINGLQTTIKTRGYALGG